MELKNTGATKQNALCIDFKAEEKKTKRVNKEKFKNS
jgi:hypothetical protein